MASNNAAQQGGAKLPNKVYQNKLVVLGDVSVGKSSIVQRFVRGQFKDHYETTIGAAYLTKLVELDDATIKFEIWDTAGQERYKSLAPMYYRGAQAAIVVYDITNPETFDCAKQWVTELRRQLNKQLVILLAGNKVDLEPRRRINAKEANAYAEENDLIFVETSAKTSTNIHEVFNLIAKKLPRVDQSKPAGQVQVGAPEDKPSTCC